MISSVDLRGTRERSSNADELRAYLQQLVGQPFLWIRFSYGDELTLHFGQPRQYRSSRLARLTKGSYIIGARASSWFLRTNVPPTVIVGTSRPTSFTAKNLKPLTPEQTERSEFLTPGSRILAVDAINLGTGTGPAYGFGLSVLLEDSASLMVLPPATTKRNHGRQRVADWEVFTPYERYLAVGPRLCWSYLSSRTLAGASA